MKNPIERGAAQAARGKGLHNPGSVGKVMSEEELKTYQIMIPDYWAEVEASSVEEARRKAIEQLSEERLEDVTIDVT